MFSLGLISGFEIPLAANGLAKRGGSGPVVWNYQLTADETLVFGRHSACSGRVVAQKFETSTANAWFAATLRVCAGRVCPWNFCSDCQPSRLNSWLSHML